MHPLDDLTLNVADEAKVLRCHCGGYIHITFRGLTAELERPEFEQLVSLLNRHDVHGVMVELAVRRELAAKSGLRRAILRMSDQELGHLRDLLVGAQLMLETYEILG